MQKGRVVSRCFYGRALSERPSLEAHHLDGRVHEAEIRLFLVRKGDHDWSHCGREARAFLFRGFV